MRDAKYYFHQTLINQKKNNTIVEIVNALRDTVTHEFLFGDKIFNILVTHFVINVKVIQKSTTSNV